MSSKTKSKSKSESADVAKMLGIEKNDFLTYLNVTKKLNELDHYGLSESGMQPNMHTGNYMNPLGDNYGLPPMHPMGAMPMGGMGYAPTSMTLTFGTPGLPSLPGLQGLPGYMPNMQGNPDNYALPNLDSLLAGYDPKKGGDKVSKSYQNAVKAVNQYLSEAGKSNPGYNSGSRGSAGSSAKGSYSSGKGK